MFNLESLIRSVGYAGVAGMVFAESGLLVGFFLPGDSLLFTAGFLASQGFFDITLLTVLCFVAAVGGDSVGYSFGARIGRRLFDRPDSRFFKKENLKRAEEFYRRNGAKAIVLARFVPVVRTFAPIVAGVGRMRYRTFVVYNVLGGLLWAAGLSLAGFWLGTKVKNVDHYLLPIIALIILLSILPGILHLVRNPERRRSLWLRARGMLRRRP